MVERQLGNLDEAARLSRHVLEFLEAAGGDEMMDRLVDQRARSSPHRPGRPRPGGTEFLGFAETTLDRAGGEWPPDERVQYEESVATLGEHLPPDDFTRFRSEGAAMSTQAALAYALDT